MIKFAAASLLAAGLAGSVRAQMSLGEVTAVLEQAASAAALVSPKSVIAVLDREGFVLGVWNTAPGPASAADIANAIAKAGTAAYLSSGQHAFSTRTAGFIVQQNFPPGIRNRPPGPLVGVNFSNLDFSDVNHFKVFQMRSPPQTPLVQPAPLPPTGGLAGTPGGVPLYKAGRLIGGVGVAGDGDTAADVQVTQRADLDEIVALAGQRGFAPPRALHGSRVLIDGIRLPYVETDPDAIMTPPLRPAGAPAPGYSPQPSPPVQYPAAVLGGVQGEVRQPIIADPVPGALDGQPRLTADEVSGIIARAAARSQNTRAGIRLSAGRPAQVFISVVNNPGTAGVPPAVLGTFRTPDATLFSWDVAVQKARTAVHFSSKTLAISTRAVGFLAQSMLPPGIENTLPGPLLGFQERVSAFPLPVNPLNGAAAPQPPGVHPALPNGITIFPGGFPLYRNGVLVGAIGISGDGVDQDDLIGMSGAAGFLPPESIRSDRFEIRGARLPYAKFPRNPGL